MGSNEEADGILVLTLRQVGCALPEEVTGIAGFVTEELVRAVSHCLHVIGDESAAEYTKVPPWPAPTRIGTSNRHVGLSRLKPFPLPPNDPRSTGTVK